MRTTAPRNLSVLSECVGALLALAIAIDARSEGFDSSYRFYLAAGVVASFLPPVIRLASAGRKSRAAVTLASGIAVATFGFVAAGHGQDDSASLMFAAGAMGLAALFTRLAQRGVPLVIKDKDVRRDTLPVAITAAACGALAWLVSPALERGLIAVFAPSSEPCMIPIDWCWPPYPFWLQVAMSVVTALASFLVLRRSRTRQVADDKRRNLEPVVRVLSVTLMMAGLIYGGANLVATHDYSLGRVSAQGCRPFGSMRLVVVSSGKASDDTVSAAAHQCVAAARRRVGLGAGLLVSGTLAVVILRSRTGRDESFTGGMH